MKRLINDLKNIHNLKQAYIQRDGKKVISTFSTEDTTMRSSIELVEQYFLAAEGIKKSYNEMIFPLNNGDNLIAILVDETTLAILLTKEKINLPMLNMALALIVKKLKKGDYQKQVVPAPPPTPEPIVVSQETVKQPSQPSQPSRPIPIASALKPKPLVQPKLEPTQTKKTIRPSFKSIFSNPFSAKKSKSKDRPYTNTQATPAGRDKKLVYRE